MIIRPVVHQLVAPTPCFDCGCFPCRCSLPTFRREPCLCGGWITAETGERSIDEGVRRHNLSTAHEHWAIREGWR